MYVANDPVNKTDPTGKEGESAPLSGKAQCPNGPNGCQHANLSQEFDERATKGKGVKSVHLNQKLSTITGGALKFGIQPDVTVVMEDG